MARHVAAHMSEAHRGAMPWKQPGVAVVYGNDGYDAGDGRARREVAELRQYLGWVGIEILGFGVDPEEGSSWAMLVRTDDIDQMTWVVWDCWGPDPDADVRLFQASIAEQEHGIKVETLLN